jgi:hypothetical protein
MVMASGERAVAAGRESCRSTSPGPLSRQATKFGRTDDKEHGRSQMLALAVIIPLAAWWWHLSRSWSEQLRPALQAMRDKAVGFAQHRQHLIADPGDASIQAWHAGIDGLQRSFRADAAALLESDDVSSARSVAVAVGLTVSLLYLTAFLPEGAVFFPDAVQEALRRPLNAVNYVRAGLAFVALHQTWLVWGVLSTAFDIATAMEANVKGLKKQASELALAGQDVQLNPQVYDGRRWGVKLLGFTVDRIAWQDCRLNVAVGIALLVAISHYIWGRIQAEREELGMRETSWTKKMIGDKDTAIHDLQEQVDTARLQVQRSSALIPFDSLEFGKRLGGGSFGDVYKGVWRGGGGVQVAIKHVRDGTLAEAEAEVELLLALRHHHVVTCYGQVTTPATPGVMAQLYIVTELCKHGSLYRMMHKTSQLDHLEQARWLVWMTQLASGMTYLHNEGVLHRDLKSENVLVADDKTLKICDFGLSRVTASAEHRSKAERGTYIYLAPELIDLEGTAPQVVYCTACDVYSYAVLINEMASRSVPWALVEIPNPLAKQVNILTRVKNRGRPELAPAIAPEFQQLVEECWAQEPQDRPGFDEVLGRLRNLASFLVPQP